jgi:hypothetical protein
MGKHRAPSNPRRLPVDRLTVAQVYAICGHDVPARLGGRIANR